jgi:short subunit dehydrogenase-like uncharacterized protein
VPYAWKVRQIDFGFGSKTAPTIPWGDCRQCLVQHRHSEH